MASITINGSRIEVEGDATNVSICNGAIFIGGKVVAGNLKGVVRIEWSGPVASVKCDAPLTIAGDVQGDVEVDGPLNCRNVGGSVKADGPVNCGSVGGNVRADGPVVHR